jgi:SAM-dependent methyltransferase
MYSHGMSSPGKSSQDQIERWNGAAGHAWVEAQHLTDRMFKPLEALLVETIAAGSPRSVLDVGCGTGATTVAVAQRLGPAARCLGVDISEPMIEAARGRARTAGVAAEFIRANAEDHSFEPASIDALISRFGVMFFDDPVRAFTNLHHASTDAATLRLIAWRSAADNPFMTTAERAAAPLLPNLPPRRPGAPGQFAFADRQHVHGILENAGWADIDIQSIDVECTMPERELTWYLTRLGPVGVALQDADDQTRTRVVDAVRPAFDRYIDGDNVRFTAACWMIAATSRR